MTSQVAEEQKDRLLTNDEMPIPSDDRESSEIQNDLDMRPSSSRVKKVLNWNSSTQDFEMDEVHRKALREAYENWDEFERELKYFNRRDHPQVKRPSCCKAVVLYSLAFVLLLLFAYMFFIIL